MKIIMSCGAMPFGPETPMLASLGGSETAALMLAKALAARSHDVTMFCNLPVSPAPDAFPSGSQASDGVRYVSLAHYESFVTANPHDLLIAVRDPKLVGVPALAKKKVLWCHDIATTRGYKRAFEQMQFTFDEIWAVSEWHKYQIEQVTEYPAERVIAMRNGIVQHEDIIDVDPIQNQLLYASRPERGLENLIRPGGIMERLPEFNLKVAMYAHHPEHMKPFYAKIFEWMDRLPNVEFIGGKPNAELRQIIADSAAYIYPTNFEETSCILARECIEQLTPFITTSVGALPETLGECGIYFEDWCHAKGIKEPERGCDGWCELFAMFFRETMKNNVAIGYAKAQMGMRDDLYWDGVAEMAEAHARPAPVADFSRIWSLLRDGDAVAALALRDATDFPRPSVEMLDDELQFYRNMRSMDLADYYDQVYLEKADTPDGELKFSAENHGLRGQAMMEELKTLPAGSTVFEFGCGPGHLLAPLAKLLPHLAFVGFDFSEAAARVFREGAAAAGLTNVLATHDATQLPKGFDVVICSEVLEHVFEPWTLLAEVEAYAKPGGRMMLTTPFGAWEPLAYDTAKSKWKDRFHLWSLDRKALRMMTGPKQNEKFTLLICGNDIDLRPFGQHLFTYDADHAPTTALDPLVKACDHHSRHTAAAAVIAYNNEDCILKMLNSIEHQVQFVQIAHGPSTDRTRQMIDDWFADRPWMRYNVIDVPKIEVGKFGFDDARNASTEGITEEDFEWCMWIDTDEYLAGDIRRYLRDSSLDAYMLAQHHFTTEPRGKAPEIDRPARLFRTGRGYKAYGHIHEHFEVPAGGPGRAFLLPDVDLGHTGYVNEAVRRGRFFRNFPFLEWDHEVEPPRKIHHFLWLRDIVHRMRFDEENRVKLAREAVAYYNAHREDMATFGPGIFQSLAYLAEANMVLNIGVPMRISVQLDDRSVDFEGRFESYEQIEGTLGQLLKPEFAERTNRYY